MAESSVGKEVAEDSSFSSAGRRLGRDMSTNVGPCRWRCRWFKESSGPVEFSCTLGFIFGLCCVQMCTCDGNCDRSMVANACSSRLTMSEDGTRQAPFFPRGSLSFCFLFSTLCRFLIFAPLCNLEAVLGHCALTNPIRHPTWTLPCPFSPDVDI